MGSYRKLLYHLIITPYKREKVLKEINCDRLYRYLATVTKNCGCKLFAINGMEDHIHMLIYVKPDLSLSDYIKLIKTSSSRFIKEQNLFPHFKSWAAGYSIYTCHESIRTNIQDYIENQKEHHRIKSYYEEVEELLNEVNPSIKSGL